MLSYTSLILLFITAEILRRFCLSLYVAFTGPLAKVPGPLLWKLSKRIWHYHMVRGTSITVSAKLFEKYGDCVRIGPREVMFRSKDAIQQILVESDLKKAEDYKLLQEDPHVSNMFTETDTKRYKQMRRPLSAGFSISFLNGLEPLMQSCVNFMVEILESRCASQDNYAIVDVSTMFGNLAMDVMSATLFGGSFGLVISEDPRMKNIFLRWMKWNFIFAAFPFMKYVPFTPDTAGEMDNMIDGIVSTRRKDKDQDHKDLLQIFLDTNANNLVLFSDKHLREEMRLFMIAGSDTTATTAMFTLLLLLNNPDKFQALVQEILTAFPDKDEPIVFAATQELPYLNASINESMRLMPIVLTGLPRETTETTFIDGYEIPKKCLTTAYINMLQKDPRVWPDAESYIPERWLGEYKGVVADRKAFMPFSTGSRNCIGQQFALRELRLILATMIRRFDLTLVPGQSHELMVHTVPYLKEGKYLVGMKMREK
ncbi:hypothetical protein CJF32_00010693 [Rutstroemia sp. NJR-2017a WRK4]|nr:hypothetical protein CJF32_00010693 [Rutstroemia sp. NJR-2017a WRK4]